MVYVEIVRAAYDPRVAAPLSENLCWLLGRASQRLSAELGVAFAELGLSPRGHMVLSEAARGEHSQIELARAVGLDKTTMVVTIDELERAGLAERRPSPSDRRARVIAVTAAGQAKLREAEILADAVRDDVLGALGARERAAFVDGLSKLVAERLH